MLTTIFQRACTQVVQVLACGLPAQHSQTHIHRRPVTFSEPISKLQCVEASCVNARDGFGG